VFYTGITDNNVHHAWWDPATDPQTINHDLWTTDGNLVGGVTTLVTG
jgi:hypothetical protein